MVTSMYVERSGIQPADRVGLTLTWPLGYNYIGRVVEVQPRALRLRVDKIFRKMKREAFPVFCEEISYDSIGGLYKLPGVTENAA